MKKPHRSQYEWSWNEEQQKLQTDLLGLATLKKRANFKLKGVNEINQSYIINFELIDLFWCTRCITSAKSSAQLTTLIFLLSCFRGMESVTISS